MSPSYELRRRQWLPTSPAETFAFFERPENLPLITPPWLDFRILTPPPIAMANGLVLDYQVRVMGVRTHWRSVISEYDPPHGFRDVQVIGPYRRWEHRHAFIAADGGTSIEDVVVYAPPGGPFGAVLERLMIRPRLEAIFDYRRRRIEDLVVRPDRADAPAAARRSSSPAALRSAMDVGSQAGAREPGRSRPGGAW